MVIDTFSYEVPHKKSSRWLSDNYYYKRIPLMATSQSNLLFGPSNKLLTYPLSPGLLTQSTYQPKGDKQC